MTNWRLIRYLAVVVFTVALPCEGYAGLVSAKRQAVAGPYDREEISLNGIWDFYPEGKNERQDIRVPSFWDAPQDYEYPAEWLHMRRGVYRKLITIPTTMLNKQIFLKIERVSVIAKVFVNDTHVGGETSGGYLMMQLPYLIDITQAAKPGQENAIEVHVWGGESLIHGQDPHDAITNAKDFPADAMDGGKLLYPWCVDHWDGRRGINGDVLLVSYPKLYVSDVFVIPDLKKNSNPADDELCLRIIITNRDTISKTVTVRNEAVLVGGGSKKTFEDQNITVAANTEQTVILSDVPWEDAKYWWPHDPKLYVLQTSLVEGDEVVDRIHTRFGFRQFYVRRNHYGLNGIRANLRGDAFEFSWHEGYRHGPSTCPVLSTKELTIDVQKRLVEEYKKLNMNVLRPHKACGIDELYDYCDEIGMMVMDEAPFWQTHQRTDIRAAHHFADWVRRWVTERKNHPSIVIWVAANECYEGPIPMVAIQTVKSIDISRPVIHDGSSNAPGDEDNRHYTGGYPAEVFNTDDLYGIYKANPSKPTGEGESLFADGWPLKNPDGTLSDKRSERGQWDNPDIISQAEWVQGVSRIVRAMRYAELADSRVYASWMYCFEVIEDDIRPHWLDMTAPGIKPVVIHRPICNTFTHRHPTIIKADGYDYFRNSYAPVAVFDKQWDNDNRIGFEPKIYHPGDTLQRKLVIYNDEFSGGTTVKVVWQACFVPLFSQGQASPRAGGGDQIKAGLFDIDVPYGHKKHHNITFKIPTEVTEMGWLDVTLASYKGDTLKFQETNRIGVINGIPSPQIHISPSSIDLGELPIGQKTQWHKIKLINQGGGLSEKWTASCTPDLIGDDLVHLNRRSGNLRGEEEVYFQVDTSGLKPSTSYTRTLIFTGQNGSSDLVRINFRTVIEGYHGTARGFEHFVTRQGDKLMEGQNEYCFISFNIPNLHYVEDNLAFEETNPWRLPDEFEITDALTAVKQMGGRVVRIYTLSVRKPDEDPAIPRHVLGPGQFNEEAFRALDKVLEVANKTGVRVIIPFVDNWVWWGGIAEYAGFRGKDKEEFWTDPQIIADFKRTIEYVINRTNTYTGIKYKDDKAILAWETGNELQCPVQWTGQIASYIKSLDKNHLLIDGFFTSVLRDESLDEPLVDIVTTHHYPKDPQEMLEQVKANRARAKGKKPYFVGEFGFIETDAVRELFDTVISEGISGALIWSLRFHNRDGGFYWHSEPFGGDKYKAYHWPGFASGNAYDERNLMKLMCRKAYEIQGLPVPQLPIPQPPGLLPIDDVAAISWQGSAGATSYTVERALSADGPWTVIGKDISDAAVPYRPLFNDENVEIGKQYFYRVKAKNDSGISEPSNVVGPVVMRHLTLIDEMKDFSLVNKRSGFWRLETKQARRAKEDMNRLKLSGEGYIVYRVPLEIDHIRVYSFISSEPADIKFAVSGDGEKFEKISVQRKDSMSGAGESNAYGYMRPVGFYAVNRIPDVRYLKIESAEDVQISRVEINYGGSHAMINKERVESFLKSVQNELEQDILPFWIRYCRDNEYGGFIGRMTNDRTIVKDAPKGLVLNARILWTFSAAYQFDKKDQYLQIAKHAYDYLMQYFWDRQFGGAYWLLDHRGKAMDDSKELYGQSFLIYGLSEYYLATGDSTSLEKAKELFYLIEKHCHDDANKGYFETFERDWSAAEKARLATGDSLEKKTMNTHLHLLEAYTNLYRVWKDEKLRTRLKELIDIFQKHIINSKIYHFDLFFDEQWHSTKDIVSFGHDIEGSWLLCEAAEVLGQPEQNREIVDIALKIAEAVYEQGLDEDGGLFYEGQAGNIIDTNREWWPQAEAVVGFLNAYQLSGREHFFKATFECWEFIEQHIVDRTHGEWFWRVARDGTPDLQQPKVSEWKCPYHNSRACLETIKRLKTINMGPHGAGT